MSHRFLNQIARVSLFACVAAAVTSCGEPAPTTPPASDANTLGDIGFGGGDVAAIKDTAQTDTQLADDGGTDTESRDPSLASVLLAGPDALNIGAIAKITVSAETLTGKPASTEKAAFADGVVAIEVGANLGHNPEDPPRIAVWKHADDGTWWLTALRPGEIELVANVAGIKSAPLKLTVTWPDTPVVRVSIPGATAELTAERVLDDPKTIRLTGKKPGAGGGSFTVRLPVTADTADVFDVEKPPASGGLSLQATIADLAETKVTLAKGRIYIDETGKGLLRGVFHGLAASLKPIAGVFMVQRQGKFGIDALDSEPLVIAKSDATTPETGNHHSRLSLGSDGAKALVLHRHISGKYKAHLLRHTLEPISGKLTELAPVAPDLTAYTGLPGGKPGPFNEAVGLATVAQTDVTFIVWEGRKEKGHSVPNGLWIRAFDTAGKPVSETASVASDPCEGACRPVSIVVAGVLHVVWTAPGSSELKMHRVKTKVSDAKIGFLADNPVVLEPKGVGAQLAQVGAAALLTWHDTAGVNFARVNGAGLKGKTKLAGTDASTPAATVVGVDIAGTGTGGFFAVITCRKTQLIVEKVSDSGVKFGNTVPVGSCNNADRLLAAQGQPGQAVVVMREPANTKYGIVARKVQWPTPGADPEQLGADLAVASVQTGSFIDIALTRVNDANAFVVGWSGDLDSAGVFVRRFR